MKHRILSLILIVAVLCSAALAVSAVDVPDLSRTGTISIVMHMGETLIPGGSLTLYRVGEIHEDDGNYSFVPTGVFKDCVSVFEDVQDPDLAQQLAALVKGNDCVLECRCLAVAGDSLNLFLLLLHALEHTFAVVVNGNVGKRRNAVWGLEFTQQRVALLVR